MLSRIALRRFHFQPLCPKRFITLSLYLLYFSIFISFVLFLFYLRGSPSYNALYRQSGGHKPFRLLDLDSFRYRIATAACQNVSVMLLVTSHQGNVAQRAKIRRAYPIDHLSSLGVGRVFLLGTASSPPSTDYASVSERAIASEATRYGDLVQADLGESYRRLVYKHVMGLHWALQNCHANTTRYLIKMDDDIVLDLYQLLQRISLEYEPQQLLAGWLHFDMEPLRRPDSKWFVSDDELSPGTRYPPFLSGWMYVASMDVADALLSALGNLTSSTPPFWIDDVFVTGWAARFANVSLSSLNAFFTPDWRSLYCCVQDPRARCDFFVGPDTEQVASFMVQFVTHARRCWRMGCVRRRSVVGGVRRGCAFKRRFAGADISNGTGSAVIVPVG